MQREESLRVHDEHGFAIAHNRGTYVLRYLGQHAGQRLDDDFDLAEEMVDDEAIGPQSRLNTPPLALTASPPSLRMTKHAPAKAWGKDCLARARSVALARSEPPISEFSPCYGWCRSVKVFGYGDVSLPPDEVREPARSYTPDESLQLIENAPSLKWKTCFALTAVLGLRCGEVLGLTWDAIDIHGRVLSVRQSVVEGQIQTVKSKNSRRDLHLPEYLVNLLDAYRSAEWRENKWNLLFTNHRNKPYHANRVREFVFNPLRDRLGLGEGALHAFRHGAATAQLQAGASIVTVKENLGHAKIETTMRYTHAISADQREAVDKLAALFERRRAETAEFCGVLRRNEQLSA